MPRKRYRRIRCRLLRFCLALHRHLRVRQLRAGTIAAGRSAGAMADAFALSQRCVLHLDLDSFFLSVHKRRDPTLPLDSKPVVLYQFQDVICANIRAKALGVRKHMRPREARALVEPHSGLVLHAFSRDWPGPRVRYGPYNAASREFFDALADALTATGAGAAIERGSIDEAFVELEKPRDPAAFCGRLRAAVEGATGLRVTVGCGPNKLLAKLASSAAKGTDAALRVVDGPVLHRPGCGRNRRDRGSDPW